MLEKVAVLNIMHSFYRIGLPFRPRKLRFELTLLFLALFLFTFYHIIVFFNVLIVSQMLLMPEFSGIENQLRNMFVSLSLFRFIYFRYPWK